MDLVAQGQRGNATGVLRDAIKTDPSNGDACLLLGSILMEEGQESESIDANRIGPLSRNRLRQQ